MNLEDVRYEAREAVAIITLDRPERLNAARVRTIDELRMALDRADGDDAIRAVIVTGAGRAFCAGADVENGFDLPTGGDPATGVGVPSDIGGRVTLRLLQMRKPVIAAINGAAAGFGATVILAMDRRFASSSAKFVYPFVRRGIMAESCSSWFLPRLVGMSSALDWMLTGRTIPVTEALAKGLVDEVTEPDQVLDRALAYACEIASQTAPMSVAVTRQLLWRMANTDHPQLAHNLESRALTALLAHSDALEGVASFIEKRSPSFGGKASATDFMDKWWDDVN